MNLREAALNKMTIMFPLLAKQALILIIRKKRNLKKRNLLAGRTLQGKVKVNLLYHQPSGPIIAFETISGLIKGEEGRP